MCHYMIQPLVELYGGQYGGAKGLVMWYYATDLRAAMPPPPPRAPAAPAAAVGLLEIFAEAGMSSHGPLSHWVMTFIPTC